jgi:hypothetical protein
MFKGETKFYSQYGNNSDQKKNQVNLLVIYSFTRGLNFIYIQQHL